jgi:hypothetical protein
MAGTATHPVPNMCSVSRFLALSQVLALLAPPAQPPSCLFVLTTSPTQAMALSPLLTAPLWLLRWHPQWRWDTGSREYAQISSPYCPGPAGLCQCCIYQRHLWTSSW